MLAFKIFQSKRETIDVIGYTYKYFIAHIDVANIGEWSKQIIIVPMYYET